MAKLYCYAFIIIDKLLTNVHSITPVQLRVKLYLGLAHSPSRVLVCSSGLPVHYIGILCVRRTYAYRFSFIPASYSVF